MLCWSKMRCWSRVLILATVALVVLNAQCFAKCLTQTTDSGPAHCHQHGKAKSGHCSLQHDLRVGSAGSVARSFLITWVKPPPLSIHTPAETAVELLAPSPPVPCGQTT